MTDDPARPWAAPGHERHDAAAPAAAPPPGAAYPGAPGPAADPGRHHGPPPGYPQAAPFAVSEGHRRRVLAGPGYDSPAYRNHPVAVAALVLGIIGVPVPGVCLAAVALGHLGVHRVRTSYHGGRGLAVAGAVLGYVMTAVWLAVVVLQLVLNSL